MDYDGWKHRLVLAELFQAKGDRYYFSETMRLGRGEIFTSRIDLNRECGAIEELRNPGARYCTPVFDSEGRRRGIVAINVSVGKLLRFANAGHCPPVLVKPDGSAVTLMSTGIPLGVADELETGDAEVQLFPGDRLLVYSDAATSPGAGWPRPPAEISQERP